MAAEESKTDDQAELIGSKPAEDSAVMRTDANDERLLLGRPIAEALLAGTLATDDLVDTDEERRDAATEVADDTGAVTTWTCAQK
jgi:hypothetical protein